MASYKIEKQNHPYQIKKEKISIQGLQMNPKLKDHPSFVDVNEIIVVNPNLKEKVLIMQFNLAFRRLLRLIMSIASSEDSDAEMEVAFNEIERMKRILKEKYQHQINMEEYHKMWRKSLLLESDLKQLLIRKTQQEQNRYIQQMENSQEEERGRGR